MAILDVGKHNCIFWTYLLYFLVFSSEYSNYKYTSQGSFKIYFPPIFYEYKVNYFYVYRECKEIDCDASIIRASESAPKTLIFEEAV